MYREELAKLSNQELIALVLAQASQIEELTRRIAELETKLGGPPKPPDNSSLPPSLGRKPNQAERRAANKRKGRPGVFRALAPNPDRIVASVAEHCPHCERALTPADQVGFHAYDHIELPLIRPVITRIHRHRGVCPGCRRGFSAPPPAGMSPGSPFGPDLIALILHLHVTQAIGFERLVCLLDEVFGVRLSEGAIANMLARAGTPLTAAAETTAAEIRGSKVVASDETSALTPNQFNTTSSMGRLTLNVLLSFAQFEREVTGERIRDKIAASKKKGMWMGGLPSLGYDVKDRKLVINETEAETVRYIFRRYVQLRSVRALKEE